MSYVRPVHLICDLCPATNPTQIIIFVPGVTAARVSARVEGWRQDKLGRDVCPAHPKLKGARRGGG